MRYGKPECTAKKKGHRDGFAESRCPACSPRSYTQEGATGIARPATPSSRFHESTDLPINRRTGALRQSHNMGQQKVVIARGDSVTWDGTWFEGCTFDAPTGERGINFGRANVGLKDCAVEPNCELTFGDGSEIDGLSDSHRSRLAKHMPITLSDHVRARRIQTPERRIEITGSASFSDSTCETLTVREDSCVTVGTGVHAERFIYIRRGSSGSSRDQHCAIIIDQPGQLVFIDKGVNRSIMDIRVPTMIVEDSFALLSRRNPNLPSSSRPLDYYEAWRDVARRPTDDSEGVYISADNNAAREWALNAGVVIEESEFYVELDEDVMRIARQMFDNP